jgi:hypothetical protein
MNAVKVLGHERGGLGVKRARGGQADVMGRGEVGAAAARLRAALSWRSGAAGGRVGGTLSVMASSGSSARSLRSSPARAVQALHAAARATYP